MSAGGQRVVLVRCIGCGAIDPSAECLGICDDRRVELVRADDHDRAVARAEATAHAAGLLGEVVERLAAGAVEDDAEAAYRALQLDARAALRAAGALEPEPGPAPELVSAWSCAACGRIEAPQPCLGVCVRHPTGFVSAEHHRDALAGARRADDDVARLARLVRQLAWSTPRASDAGGAGDGYAAALRTLGDRARALVAASPR